MMFYGALTCLTKGREWHVDRWRYNFWLVFLPSSEEVTGSEMATTRSHGLGRWGKKAKNRENERADEKGVTAKDREDVGRV